MRFLGFFFHILRNFVRILKDASELLLIFQFLSVHFEFQNLKEKKEKFCEIFGRCPRFLKFLEHLWNAAFSARRFFRILWNFLCVAACSRRLFVILLDYLEIPYDSLGFRRFSVFFFFLSFFFFFFCFCSNHFLFQEILECSSRFLGISWRFSGPPRGA